MLIGVLAVQGAFIEHQHMLNSLRVPCKQIRQRADLDTPIDGLILPGGESSVMGNLLHALDLFEPIQKSILDGLPVFGTCAGMILLAKDIQNDSKKHLSTMDIQVKRNAYGRQLASFTTTAPFAEREIKMPFIRAPYIEKCTSMQKDVEVLAVVDEHIVAARQNNQLVTAFHPELTPSSYVHEYFLDMI